MPACLPACRRRQHQRHQTGKTGRARLALAIDGDLTAWLQTTCSVLQTAALAHALPRHIVRVLLRNVQHVLPRPRLFPSRFPLRRTISSPPPKRLFFLYPSPVLDEASL